MIGHASVESAHARARASNEGSDALLPVVTQCQVGSSKHPERNLRDQTRPLAHDSMQASVRFSLARILAHVSVHHISPDIGPALLVSFWFSAQRQIPVALSLQQLTRRPARVRSLRLVMGKQPLDFTNLTTLA
jgi:hypothetical protein